MGLWLKDIGRGPWDRRDRASSPESRVIAVIGKAKLTPGSGWRAGRGAMCPYWKNSPMVGAVAEFPG